MDPSNPENEYYENGNLKTGIELYESWNKKSVKLYYERGNLHAEIEYHDNGHPKSANWCDENGSLMSVNTGLARRALDILNKLS